LGSRLVSAWVARATALSEWRGVGVRPPVPGLTLLFFNPAEDSGSSRNGHLRAGRLSTIAAACGFAAAIPAKFKPPILAQSGKAVGLASQIHHKVRGRLALPE